MLIRKLFTAAAAISALAIAAPIAAANADTPPSSPERWAASLPLLTFIPPSVGPICVAIGPIIIGGEMISSGVHVCTQGASLPPLSSQSQS
jgi:hypothetical protein